jgi:hypothetical protein
MVSILAELNVAGGFNEMLLYVIEMKRKENAVDISGHLINFLELRISLQLDVAKHLGQNIGAGFILQVTSERNLRRTVTQNTTCDYS